MRKEFSEAIVKEAEKWVGVLEVGGANKGQQVEEFQKTVDGKAQGESWCMCFVQFCLSKVRQTLGVEDGISRSEHCLTVWNKTDKKYRRDKPEPGFIVIWRHGNTTNGHTGFVIEASNPSVITTIEGNTGPSKGEVERNGDGVYRKRRLTETLGSMRIVGYLDPFADAPDGKDHPDEMDCGVGLLGEK